jgi:CRISPR-associated protein Csx14
MMQDAGCKMQDAGCKMQDARCKMQDAGFVLLDSYSRFLICHLPFAICHSPFAIRHLPFAICHSPFAICHLPFTMESTSALITMGGQAQVVTFALDALLAQGETLTSVIVLHLSAENPRVRRALAQLAAEFAGERYRGHPMTLRHVPLHVDGRALPEIQTAREAEGAWALGRDVLATLKRDGQRLHVCIAGGPRLLALTLTTAAALHCDHHDRLWHLYTPRAFIEQAHDGTILHAPPAAGVTLLPVPLIPWGAYLPGLRTLTQPTPSISAPPDAAQCAMVWARLTEREKEALRALADGLRPQEAADALCVTLKTLDTFKTKILAECRNAWEMPEGTHLTYHFLREKFGGWMGVRS